MKMQYLSFRFYISWMKYLIIISSVIVNLIAIVIVSISLVNPDYSFIESLKIIAFLLPYIFFSSIYDYLLFKSKTVQTDGEYLYIEQGRFPLKVHLSCIDKFERKFYYFYKISFKKEFGIKSELYIFISPNPPFKRPKKFNFIHDLTNKDYA